MSVVAMYTKWRRDEGLSTSERVWKARQYLLSSAMTPLRTWRADSVGSGVRCIGRPLMVNLGTMTIGAHVVLRSRPVSVELATSRGGELSIGAFSSINSGSSIHADRLVQLGERVRVGPLVHIMDTSFHDLDVDRRRPDARPVFIGDDVWICMKATVLPGVTIGNGAVVAAHSLVTKDVPAGAIVMGCPARVVGESSDRPEATEAAEAAALQWRDEPATGPSGSPFEVRVDAVEKCS